MTKTAAGFYALLACATLSLMYLFGFVFLVAPTAQAQAGGIAQKIFYFHVPSAYGMYLSGVVCMFGSAAYLLKPTDLRDAIARAGAECATLFSLVILTSGPLWAKTAWGIYWTWDPRLTTVLLTAMIYTAIVVVRTFAGDGDAERKFAAALGVLGTVNLPIIKYSVQKWGGTHPEVISGKGGGLQHPDMVHALLAGFVAVTLFSAVLLWSRAALASAAARVRRAEQVALQEGLLDS